MRRGRFGEWRSSDVQASEERAYLLALRWRGFGWMLPRESFHHHCGTSIALDDRVALLVSVRHGNGKPLQCKMFQKANQKSVTLGLGLKKRDDQLRWAFARRRLNEEVGVFYSLGDVFNSAYPAKSELGDKPLHPLLVNLGMYRHGYGS